MKEIRSKDLLSMGMARVAVATEAIALVALLCSAMNGGEAMAAPEKTDWRKMITVAERKRDAQGNLLPLQSYDETIRRGMTFLLDGHLQGFKGAPETLVDEQGQTQMPWVYYSNLQHDGTPFANSVDRFVSYPAFHHSLLIRTFLGYGKHAKDPRALEQAVKLADWNIAHSTPADWPYGRLPYSTFQEKKPGGFRDKTGLMPDKAAIMALAYLEIYEATKEVRFKDAATAIGQTLRKRQRPDGTWPFRVDPQTEQVIEEYTSSVIYAVMLFEKLDALNHNNHYRPHRDRAWQWLLSGPIKTKEFRGFYEDIPASPKGRTNYDCLDTIRYLLVNRTDSNGYLEMARDLNQWVEDTFKDKIKGFEPAEGIREQLQCNVVMGVHSLNWASALLELSEATGDKTMRQRAVQTANYVTYYLQPDNRIVVGFSYHQWWYSCHAGVILHLLDFQKETRSNPRQVRKHARGLHGYIGYQSTRPPAKSEFNMGMGFYSAVWPLIDKPIARFQIGLAGSWILPDNSDNKDKPLAPEGTRARKWAERGPTWDSVFQTLEGGLGYWARNRFRYGPPKFSMNATPQCYDYEVGSPGWSFFYDTEALPDNRLGIAQLSNRLLIPPDALPFEGNPRGKFLGYAYMALPFTDPVTGDPPTGDQSWTCFLSAANFKGPIAYYIPETWSKIGKLFDYPFIYGRGLDSRPGRMGGGAMEINTVPCLESTDDHGNVYAKIPRMQFPVDDQGRTLLVQDVTYYSKTALYNAFKDWRKGGPACSGSFNSAGAWKSTLTTRTTRYDQASKPITDVEQVFDTQVYSNDVWGLKWFDSSISPKGVFPQYYKQVGDKRVAIPADEVPEETGLLTKEFELAKRGQPFTSPGTGAWSEPGPKLGPFTVTLIDGSKVTYSWYRFVDQPSFQQYKWSEAKKEQLQAFVERIHARWPIDRDYMAPPTHGELAALDPALFVTPPEGLEVGYVPIVTRQEDARDK